MIEIDCTGMLCPLPIIETARAIRKIENGQAITLLADDPATEPDLVAWARMTGNKIEVLAASKFLITKTV